MTEKTSEKTGVNTDAADDDLVIDMSIDEVAQRRYVFDASLRAEVLDVVAKANRKCERFGITGRFEAAIGEPREISETLPSGLSATRSVIDVELNTPTLAYSGWEFVATIVHEEAGTIARTVPGKSLEGWAPQLDTVCDHCHTRRYRRDTYIVRHIGITTTDESGTQTVVEPATGEVKQVGSNCLEAFLGIKVTGLWLLGYDPIESNEFTESSGGSFGADHSVEVRDVIRYTLAASDFGKGFVSRSAARFDYGRQATVDIAARLMWGVLSRKERDELAVPIANVPAVTDELIDSVIAAGIGIDGSGEYAENMRVAMACKRIDTRTMGLVASAVSVWNRAETRKIEDAARENERAEIAKGFLGDSGDLLTGIEATITDLTYIEGDYGTTTLITFLTADNHRVKWFSSAGTDLDKGAAVTITRARVKGHDTYHGVDATVIKLAKLAERETVSA